ncbi:uncharacterized protein LOC119992280 [Tripterygium wilfordii]|uniref:uncharacterized protein LOC119992280 n=1 Tax=Tripterygium wilfordii TaxID=458696 RepID=UPI0018F860E1|nr:uncharacterized protein LOC119992280 [Tripterygium wilfordii]
MQVFHAEMDKIKGLDEAAWKYLNDIPPYLWTRAAFSTYSKNDTIVNNMSESFNSKILPVRDRPIITMLEELRGEAMERHVKLRTQMERKHGRLVPEVHDRLDKEFIKSRSWTAKWIRDNQKAIFQVTKKPYQYVVNVDEASCTCRGWDLSGIPCTHAVAAICWLHRDPAEFVHQAYTKKTYLKVYEHNVQPTNGENLWVAVGGDAIEAPPMKKVVGGPTKKRRREHDEAASRSRLRRRYPKIRCTKCGGEGHNRRGCKNPPMPEVKNLSLYY